MSISPDITDSGDHIFCADCKRLLFCGALCMVLLFLISVAARADISESIEECAKIEDKAIRLKCYDGTAGRTEAPIEPAGVSVSGTKPESQVKLSYLERLWELNKDAPRGHFPISTYRSNYLLPITYVESPNEHSIQEADAGKSLTNAEVAFQISIKTKLRQDIFGYDVDLWFAYTQRSFWQFYNFSDSSPFRETNYEPEMLLNFRMNRDLHWLKLRFINVGINHQSNGQSDPLSRSWNRVAANFGFERDNLALILKTWLRIPEGARNDNNPDIERYLGYGELWSYYFWNDSRFGLMLRNNFDFYKNRSAVQLEWSYPLVQRISLYVQYFNGYGESMLDYKNNINRIGIGFVIKDWD
jgi:phospholipase A1/A2